MWQIKKKLKKQFMKYSSLWRTVLQVMSINVTFAQINSSLPSVIDIEWPEEWKSFLRNFSFVNIDIMSLIGIGCVGDFNFYISFICMVSLPVGIVVMTLFHYHGSVGMLHVHMEKMTDAERDKTHRFALYKLFELADADHSETVEPSELAQIIRCLGWKIKLEEAMQLAKALGAQRDESGHLLLTEDQFVEAMMSNRTAHVLEEMKIPTATTFAKDNAKRIRRKSTYLNTTSHASASKHGHKWKKLRKSRTIKQKYQQTAATLNAKNAASTLDLANTTALVKWTLKTSIVSHSLSGATQLLLLAHTPVSRKVFQYFNCHSLAGKRLMRADYAIDCDGRYYFFFSPIVLSVLGAFTIALPTVISYYLWYHRKSLYSTMTYSKLGWLYAPFVRGAEFWNVRFIALLAFFFFGSRTNISFFIFFGAGSRRHNENDSHWIIDLCATVLSCRWCYLNLFCVLFEFKLFSSKQK